MFLCGRPVVGRIEWTHEGHAGRTEDQGRHHKKAINPGTDKIGKRKQQIDMRNKYSCTCTIEHISNFDIHVLKNSPSL